MQTTESAKKKLFQVEHQHEMADVKLASLRTEGQNSMTLTLLNLHVKFSEQTIGVASNREKKVFVWKINRQNTSSSIGSFFFISVMLWPQPRYTQVVEHLYIYWGPIILPNRRSLAIPSEWLTRNREEKGHTAAAQFAYRRSQTSWIIESTNWSLTNLL